MKKFILPLIIAFIIQIFLSNVLSIRGVKPDFIILFLVYFSLNQGSFRGVVTGFLCGMILSVIDNNPIFGILPLTYSIIGYGFGILKNYKKSISPLKFNSISYLIIICSFFINSYFLFESIFYNDFSLFIGYWFKNMSYTITLIIISQMILPFNK